MAQVDDIPPEQHALVPSFMGGGSGGGKRIHPLPFSDPGLQGDCLFQPFYLHTIQFADTGDILLLSVDLLLDYSNFVVQPRSMDPSKDLAAYGYGSVAWKERMELWKQKQAKLQMTKDENGGRDWDYDGDSPDLPLLVPFWDVASF